MCHLTIQPPLCHSGEITKTYSHTLTNTHRQCSYIHTNTLKHHADNQHAHTHTPPPHTNTLTPTHTHTHTCTHTRSDTRAAPNRLNVPLLCWSVCGEHTNQISSD